LNAYSIRRKYQEKPSQQMLLGSLDDKVHYILSNRRGPFRLVQMKNGAPFEPGPYKSVAEGLSDWMGRLANAKPGQNYRFENRTGWMLWVYVRTATNGMRIIAAAKSQMGVPYVFGAQDPDTDGAGPDKGAFDCSGLTAWAYNTVGVYLPHSADMQMRDGRVIYTDHPEQGDLVWFNFGRLAAGHADHVGIWYKPGYVIDTRNPDGEPVAIRPIEIGNVLHMGYVRGVTH
jgi:hypothetical protein